MSALPAPAAVTTAEIAEIARLVRIDDLEMVVGAGLGHLGSDFSAIDILATLYFGVLRIDPSDPQHPDRDRFVLSKGHSAGALYVVLAHAGFIDRAELRTFAQPESRLNGHPNRRKVPGVETNTGPLGHGLPVAVGIAKAARIRGASFRTWVLCGDGELQEGSMWEAAMAAGMFGLDNLTLIVDRNTLQQGARTETTMRLDPLGDRFRSFGWHVVDADGHDHASLRELLGGPPGEPGRPTCVIAHTTKGHGVSFMADQVAWHHRVPDADEHRRALLELEATA